MGTSCLALVWVMGRKRVPLPPQSINAFIELPSPRPRTARADQPRTSVRRSEGLYGRGEGLSTPNTARLSCSDVEHHPGVPAIPVPTTLQEAIGGCLHDGLEPMAVLLCRLPVTLHGHVRS